MKHDFTAAFAARGLSARAAQALAEYDDLFEDRLAGWFGSLWDGGTGGFYYARSARDHEGFLPDLESTNQTVNALCRTGFLERYGGDRRRGLPLYMQQGILRFASGCLDPDDGYFYHPQWGKDISEARRGRDLSWGISLIRSFGGTFPYPTAQDRLRSGAGTGAMPPYLKDRQTLLDYLAGLNITRDSHSTGHRLNSVTTELEASGLLPECLDYLDSIQCARTGLWQQDVSYTSLSGLFKLGALYNRAGRPLRYTDRMIDSAVEAILSDEKPTILIYVYNPWAGLNTVRENIRLSGGDLAGFYRRMSELAPRLLEVTRRKLELFRRSDGAFSYDLFSAAPYTQRSFVCLGGDEGDVNATSIAVNGLSGGISCCLCGDVMPIFSDREYRIFLEEAAAARPEKVPLPSGLVPGELPRPFIKVQKGSVRHDSTGALLSSMAASSDSLGYFIGMCRDASAVEVRVRLTLQSRNPDGVFRVQLGCEYAPPAYILEFCKEADGTYLMRDVSSRAANADRTVLYRGIPEGVRFDLSFSYPCTGSAEAFCVPVSLNGIPVAQSRLYAHERSTEAPRRDMTFLTFSALAGTCGEMHIDQPTVTLSVRHECH